MFNLLTNPLIKIQDANNVMHLRTLPGVYDALMSDQIISFPSLRPHQRHAWHSFLVQLGTMSIQENGGNDIPETAGEWRNILLNITGSYNPWEMVNGVDYSQPAFMQPPIISEERKGEYRRILRTPNELDILIASINHETKNEALLSDPDDWIFALIALQTMQGFSGNGHYGISRMNAGFGNRPSFSLAPASITPGAHVRRDIAALLEIVPPADGEKLLWLLPWDGTKDELLSQNQMHPLFIEVCRPIRFYDANGQLQAKLATSKGRINTKEGHPVDPWAPFNTEKNTILTISGAFTYKRVNEYLLASQWRHPLLLKPTSAERQADQPMRLLARAMVRGQGKTNGYYERDIQIRPKLLNAIAAADMQEMESIVKVRMASISKVQRILSHAIQMFMASGEHEQIIDGYRAMGRPWLQRLDEHIDRSFFSNIQDELEANVDRQQSIHDQWLHHVIEKARASLHDAMNTLPATYRYKGIVQANYVFEGRMRGPTGFPALFNASGATESPLDEEDAEDAPAVTDFETTVLDLLRYVNSRIYRDNVQDMGPAGAAMQFIQQAKITTHKEQWQVIIDGMSTMSQNSMSHNRFVPVGRVLYDVCGDKALCAMMSATSHRLHAQLRHLFHTISTKKLVFNWYEMSDFILNEGEDKGASRILISSAYYRTQYHNKNVEK